MHFILEVELKDPPTAPGLALVDDRADNGTCDIKKLFIVNIKKHTTWMSVIFSIYFYFP